MAPTLLFINILVVYFPVHFSSQYKMAGKFWGSKQDTTVHVSSEKDVPLSSSENEAQSAEGEVLELNNKYKSPFRYRSPLVQVFISSLAAFGCPGMFNALTGIGAGGIDQSTSDKGQIALQSVFAGGSLFLAPLVYYYIGPGYTMLAGGLFYPIYSGSLLNFQKNGAVIGSDGSPLRDSDGNHIYHKSAEAFVVAASAILGIGASLFWTGQGAVVTSEPLENEKGRLFGMFWFVFNLGGVLGSFISMGINWDNDSTLANDTLYAIFIALMGAGWLCSLGVLKPDRIIRSDGTRIHEKQKRPNVIRDFVGICKILTRKESLVLTPFFFMANYFYSYQQNTFNGKLFTVRTRSFNSAMYWLAQMIAAPLYGAFLDNKRIRHRTRGFYAFLFLCVYSLALWGGGLALNLRSCTSGASYYLGCKEDETDYLMDFAGFKGSSGTKFAGPFVLYFLYGMFDSFWQTLAYWIMGSLTTNDTEDEDRINACYVGLYKGMQAAGAAVAWKVNLSVSNSDIEFGLNWGLISASLLILTPIFWWIKEPRDEREQNYNEYIE